MRNRTLERIIREMTESMGAEEAAQATTEGRQGLIRHTADTLSFLESLLFVGRVCEPDDNGAWLRVAKRMATNFVDDLAILYRLSNMPIDMGPIKERLGLTQDPDASEAKPRMFVFNVTPGETA